MLSDEGPWRDPQWAKPAKWEREGNNAINDQPGMSGSNGVPHGGSAAPHDQEDAHHVGAPAGAHA